MFCFAPRSFTKRGENRPLPRAHSRLSAAFLLSLSCVRPEREVTPSSLHESFIEIKNLRGRKRKQKLRWAASLATARRTSHTSPAATRAAPPGRSTPRAKVGLQSSIYTLSHKRRRQEEEEREQRRGEGADGISLFSTFVPGRRRRRLPASRRQHPHTLPLSFVSLHSTPFTPRHSTKQRHRGRPHASVHQDRSGEAGQAAAPPGVQGAEVRGRSFFLLVLFAFCSTVLFFLLSLSLSLAHKQNAHRAFPPCLLSLLHRKQKTKTGTRKRPRSSRRGAPRPRRRGSSACCRCRRAPPRR